MSLFSNRRKRNISRGSGNREIYDDLFEDYEEDSRGEQEIEEKYGQDAELVPEKDDEEEGFTTADLTSAWPSIEKELAGSFEADFDILFSETTASSEEPADEIFETGEIVFLPEDAEPEEEEEKDAGTDDDSWKEDDAEDDYYREEEEDPGIFGSHREHHFSLVDLVLGLTGIVTLLLIILAFNLFQQGQARAREVERFAGLGVELRGVSRIGGEGIRAVLDKAKFDAEVKQLPEEEPEPEPEEETPEEAVSVTMHLSTILSDLKVKFANEATGKLIANVPFAAKITGPSTDKQMTDEDKDGVIHLTGLSAGTYKVQLQIPEGYSGYKASASEQSIKVKDTLEYKKVDVADEIKTEKEINVAAEDTQKQEIVVESVLTDTVEWVESTKSGVSTQESYQTVEKSKVTPPGQSAALTGGAAHAWIVRGVHSAQAEGETASGETTEETPAEAPKIESLSLAATSIKVGESTQITVKTNVETPVVFQSGNPEIATVDASGKVTAVSVGAVQLIVSIQGEEKLLDLNVEASGNASAEQAQDNTSGQTGETGEGGEVSETADPSLPAISLSAKELTLTVGGKGKLTAKVTPDTLTEKTVTWSSAKTGVATVSEDGTVTAAGVGEAEIIAALKADPSVEAKCRVKVTEAYVPDGSKRLTDTSGNKLYVKENDTYREAFETDYDKFDVFYLRVEEVTEYRYTGWQTIDGRTYYYDKNGNKVTGEQIIQGVKYTFGEDGALPSSSTMLGIDVSKWNGSIDWGKVKNSGVSFAIIRCGYRGSSTGVLVEDPTYKTNIKNAKAAGLKVGIYFYTQAVNEVEAVEEASMAISLAQGQGLSYPIFLDVEYTSGGRANNLDVNTRTNVVKAFCQTVANSGMSAGVYANKNWLTEKLNASALGSYRIWLAQYAATPTYSGRYQMWQYTSKGKVAGIATDVDMDISY